MGKPVLINIILSKSKKTLGLITWIRTAADIHPYTYNKSRGKKKIEENRRIFRPGDGKKINANRGDRFDVGASPNRLTHCGHRRRRLLVIFIWEMFTQRIIYYVNQLS